MASFFDNKARAAAAVAKGASSTKTTASKEAQNLQPWVEKYRPKSLKDLPHMLFYGPPGTGKTSTILALAKELYGPEMFKSRVLELNASDERGISIVREKVKDFARMQLSNPPLHYKDKYPCPPYKIVILDEADSMTQDAQSALRRTMETYSKITRFCLVCNYVTRIIDPLASRCSKFRFKSLDQGNAKKRLEEIAEAENVALEDGVIDALIKCSEGDLRKAITFLQSAARLAGAVKLSQPRVNGHSKKRKIVEDEDEDAMDIDGANDSIVTVTSIKEIAGVIPDHVIDDLVRALQPKARGTVYNDVSKVVTDLVADGWSASQVTTQLYHQILYNDTVRNQDKNKICMLFSEIDKKINDGSDDHLMLLDLALSISRAMEQT
ncbi:hypothetical protein Q9189_002738 [Teloschistes chrysophthalmus]